MYTTTTEVSAPVNVVLQKELLVNAKARCPHFVGSTPASIAQHEGSFTAKWRRYENFDPVETPLAPLTGTPALPTGRVAVQPTVTDYTATVAKYGNFIVLNEEVDLVNPKNQDMKLAELLGINAGQSLNRLQRNEIEDNATAIYPTGATSDATTNSTISLGQIKKAVNSLNRSSAMTFTAMTKGENAENTSPIRPAYWGIAHSDVEEDIRLLNGFVAAERYAGQTQLADGEFGTVGGVRFVCSPEGSIDANAGNTGGTGVREDAGGTGADLYHTPIFGMDAIGSLGLSTKHIQKTYKAGDKLPAVQMITQAKGSAGSGDPFNEVSTAAWKSFHAAKILNENWIYSVRSASSDLG